ncbi:hypothetical protein GUJ93_ZPchr0012g21127 [Zizania palustris]|uniref:Uncharacterized protein n=1 Tax=Zizania palustris TaxID=103762 RepID=A0A8J5WM45_ZIZPA|nr:hypothetical protein GUJ93_ZPchr0012g21127 [Zizania palustris]
MLDTKLGFPPVPPSSAPAVAQKNTKRRREGEGEGATEMREEAVERLRGVVRDSVGKHLYASAIFLADKDSDCTGHELDMGSKPRTNA